MSRVSELFSFSVNRKDIDWKEIIEQQQCPYVQKRCFKVRKSESDISIGTCTVKYGKNLDNIFVLIGCSNGNRYLQTASIY